MKSYEFLPHTADVKFRAYGKSLEKAFENAALATFATMTDIRKVKKILKKTISVQAHDYQALLYSFLEECAKLFRSFPFLFQP